MKIISKNQNNMDFGIGSHDSFTYLPVKKWWLKPTKFMAKCQRVDFQKQIDLGVGLFDMRVKFDSKGKAVITHGMMGFKHKDSFIDDVCKVLEEKKYCLRVVLETTKPDEYQEEKFREFCARLEKTYPNLIFFGGNNRTDWSGENVIYRFKNPNEDLDDKYSSVTSFFDDDCKLLRIIDDWWPYLYAKTHNKKNIEAGTTHKWLFIDFVDIR